MAQYNPSGCAVNPAPPSRFLFLSRRPGGANDNNYDLFSASMDGSDVQRITDYPDRSIRWIDIHKPTGRVVMAYSYAGNLSMGPSSNHGGTPAGAGGEQTIGILYPGEAEPRPLIDTRPGGNNPRAFQGVWHPTFSPDGRRIVFNAGAKGEKSNIYMMNDDGTNLRAVIADPKRNYADPKFGPDGRIMFNRRAQEGDEDLGNVNDFDIWVMDPDYPHTARQVTGADVIPGPDILETDPSMSPDCKRVTFVRPTEPVGLKTFFGVPPKIHNSVVGTNPDNKIYQVVLSGTNPDRVNGVPVWVDNHSFLSYRWELWKNGWRVIYFKEGDQDKDVKVFDLGAPFGSEDLMPTPY